MATKISWTIYGLGCKKPASSYSAGIDFMPYDWKRGYWKLGIGLVLWMVVLEGRR